jgi:hypothetical protein
MHSKIIISTAGLLLLWGLSTAQYDPSPLTGYEIIDPDTDNPEYATQGEYLGTVDVNGNEVRLGVQVIARGDSQFIAMFYEGGLPGDGIDDSQDRTEVPGELLDVTAEFEGSGITAVVSLEDSTLTGQSADWGEFTLNKIFRRSPTLGWEPVQDALVIYREPADSVNLREYVIDERGYIAAEKVPDSEAFIGENTIFDVPYRNFQLHLEWIEPFQPSCRDQARGNSGVAIRDRASGWFELQVLESFGMELADNHCGAFYQRATPQLMMSLPPLIWQTYDIFLNEDEITVYQNGVIIHENLSVPSTSSSSAVIWLQDHAHPVFYRNIWVKEGVPAEIVLPVGIKRAEAGHGNSIIRTEKAYLLPWHYLPGADDCLKVYSVNGKLRISKGGGPESRMMPGVYVDR